MCCAILTHSLSFFKPSALQDRFVCETVQTTETYPVLKGYNVMAKRCALSQHLVDRMMHGGLPKEVLRQHVEHTTSSCVLRWGNVIQKCLLTKESFHGELSIFSRIVF